MNTVTIAHVAPHFGQVFAAKFTALVAFVGNEMKLRAAARELNEMDDRFLADIGINRSDIKNVVRGRV